MNRHSLLIPMLLLATCANAQAELFKWVGPDGKVTYSDAPPPATAHTVKTTPVPATPATTGAGLPYELAEAVKANPVILYASPDCAPCDLGRALLAARGIPYAEKTVSSNEDIARLREAGGDDRLPLLLVGKERQPGFSESAWAAALSAAGYPKTSRLPAHFRNPAPEPAAPRRAASAPAAARAAPGA
ncbi:MAG: glutaredoxin family protein, partial [Noviherbaspirillum sp.]